MPRCCKARCIRAWPSRCGSYAPVGPDLLDYLARAERFNRRAERPTRWAFEIHAGPDFLAALRGVRPGGLAVLAGRNRDKLALIEAVLAAGLHAAGRQALHHPARRAAAIRARARRGGRPRPGRPPTSCRGRHDMTAILLGALHRDPEVFGAQAAGYAGRARCRDGQRPSSAEAGRRPLPKSAPRLVLRRRRAGRRAGRHRDPSDRSGPAHLVPRARARFPPRHPARCGTPLADAGEPRAIPPVDRGGTLARRARAVDRW
ncbi:MAG: hypothetical protein WDO24_10575 [Pseudomonadota bacterium]